VNYVYLLFYEINFLEYKWGMELSKHQGEGEKN